MSKDDHKGCGDSFRNVLNTQLLLVIGLGFIVAFIPACFAKPRYSYTARSILAESSDLQSDSTYWLLALCLCTSVPPFLELLLDSISYIFVRADVFATLTTRLWMILMNIVTIIGLMSMARTSGNVMAYYIIMGARTVAIVSAFLHILRFRCNVIYTLRRVVALHLFLSGGVVIQVYGIVFDIRGVYVLGSVSYLCGFITLILLVVYHLLREVLGQMNIKNSIVYEILIMASGAGTIVIYLSQSDSGENGSGVVIWGDMIATTGQMMLLYVAVTHEFKWVRMCASLNKILYSYFLRIDFSYVALRPCLQDFAAALTSLSTKAVFVRFVGHEVRTPLNSCMLGLQYLESICSDEELLSPSVIVSVAKEIRDSCDDAVEIMNNLLLYEKVDGNALSLSCAPENLYLVVQKVFRSFQLGAQQLGVQVIMVVHPSIDENNQREVDSTFSEEDGQDMVRQLMVYVDRPKMHVVLRNILSNAIKFSPSNGRVLLSIDPVKHYVQRTLLGQVKNDPLCDIREASYLRVSVRDSGPGISVANQKLMFRSIVQVAHFLDRFCYRYAAHDVP